MHSWTRFLSTADGVQRVFSLLHRVGREKQKVEEFSLNERQHSPCVVFIDKLVASGGSNHESVYLRAIESYDHETNTWSRDSIMVKGRTQHSIFAIGGCDDGNVSCEAFNVRSGKFVFVKER